MSPPGPVNCSPSGVPASRHALSFTNVGWFSVPETMFLSFMLNNVSPAEAYDLIQPFPTRDVTELPAKLRLLADQLEERTDPAYITNPPGGEKNP